MPRRRYRFEITKLAFGYQLVVSRGEYGLWMEVEIGRYWTLTREGARSKANRLIERRRRADAREARKETATIETNPQDGAR